MSDFTSYAWLILTTEKQRFKVWATTAEEARKSLLASSAYMPESAIKEVRRYPLTVSDLRYFVENRGKESHFFSRSNMKFAGDTMRNYGVRARPVTIQTYSGPAECWELYRKRPVKHGLSASAFFDVQTGAQRFTEK